MPRTLKTETYTVTEDSKGHFRFRNDDIKDGYMLEAITTNLGIRPRVILNEELMFTNGDGSYGIIRTKEYLVTTDKDGVPFTMATRENSVRSFLG